MYIYSLFSVFCFRRCSVKQLKFEIYIILCQYSYHSFIKGSKNENKFGNINILDCNSLSSGYGNEFQKVWVMHNIPHRIWSFSCIYLAENKRKWAGHGLTSVNLQLRSEAITAENFIPLTLF